MALRGVIFDCDGTLVDSETISLRVLVDFVAEFGFEIPHEEALQDFAGGELPKVFAEIESRMGKPLPGDFLDQFRVRQLANLATSVTAIDGAGELLTALQMPYCVASNAPLNKIQLCLETAGLMPLIPDNQLHSAYEIQKWKPLPDLFLKAATALELAPEDCAVVEDSMYGIDAGLNANMQVFALDPHDKLPALDPSVVKVARLSELLPHFVV